MMTQPRRDSALRFQLLGMFAALVGVAAPLAAANADPLSLPIASSPATATAPTDPVPPSVRQLAAQVGLATFTAPTWRPGVVRHIILMRFKPTTTSAQQGELVQRYLHLVEDSRRPDGKPVLTSMETGIQNSAEGRSQGMQIAFIASFNSEGDRNFFIGTPIVTDPNFYDPAHAAFKQFAKPYLDGTVVFDYDVAATVTRTAAEKKRATRKGHS